MHCHWDECGRFTRAGPGDWLTRRLGRLARSSRARLSTVVAFVILCSAQAAGMPSAGAVVYLNTPFTNQQDMYEPVRPAALLVGEYEYVDPTPDDPGGWIATSLVSSIKWASWGAASASGTGQAEITWVPSDEHELRYGPQPVTLLAGGLQHCGGLSVYTSLELGLVGQVAPLPYFGFVRRDSRLQPCRVQVGEYYPGEPIEIAKGLRPGGPDACDNVRLRTPDVGPGREEGFGTTFCTLRWKKWGSPTATGTGVVLWHERLYGAEIKVSRVHLCPFWTVTYTRVTTTLWGPGQRISALFPRHLGPRSTTRIEALIGRRGQPHRAISETTAGLRCF